MEEMEHRHSRPCGTLSLPGASLLPPVNSEPRVPENGCRSLSPAGTGDERKAVPTLYSVALHMEGVNIFQGERKSRQAFIKWCCLHRIKPDTEQHQD